MKYIFITGAPGSKWSSVTKNIYYSPDIDRSDYTEERTYYHDAPGYLDLMHTGAYFDPGMEFGQDFRDLSLLNKDILEAEFDRPFDGSGIRIIKSHCFAHNLDFLEATWPESPIIAAHRPDDACLGWWVKCGHFDITYPLYHDYYRDLRTMAKHIADQNRDILDWVRRTPTVKVDSNRRVCQLLGLREPPDGYEQDYANSDVAVWVRPGKK